MTELELQDIRAVAELDYAWEKLKNKTVFISGGTGFLGDFLVNVLLYRNNYYGNNCKIIVCSRHQEKIEPFIKYIKQDIRQPFSITEPIDFVIHLASNTHPKQYTNDPVGTITTNVFGTYHLLQLAKEHHARFLLASSVEIYGNGNGQAMREEYCGPIDCNTVRAGYNEAKRVSESLCQAYIQKDGIDAVIARLARVFGADKKEDSKAMAQFLHCAVQKQDILLKSDGKQRYSYVYIADAVSGILKILLSGLCGHAYNVSDDDDGRTLGDYAQYIANMAGRRVQFSVEKESGVSQAVDAILDCEKLKNLGWYPMYCISDALARTYSILTSKHK